MSPPSPSGDPPPEPLRHRLYRLALDRASTLPAGEAVPFLLRHHLLGLARWPATPGPLRAALEPTLRRNAAANLHLSHRFQQVVDTLAGIPVCPLKGIHLLATVYAPDPESRVLTDLDLLVPEARADEAVARLGERLGLEETAASRAVAGHERTLSGEGLAVEVHTRLAIKHGWASTWEDVEPEPGEIHGRRVHCLDRETTLVHLLSHWVKHVPFTDLRWTEDILRWLDAGALDGARVAARARRLGAWRTLAAGARLLRRVLGADLLPGLPAANRGIGQALLLANERLVWRALRSDPFAAQDSASPVGRNLTACLLADRPLDALRFLKAKGRESLHRRRSQGIIATQDS